MAQPAGLPDGYRMRPDGIYQRIGTKDGSDWTWPCSPILVVALTRDGSSCGWLVEITDQDGRAHRWAIPAELVAGDGVGLRAEAMRRGLRLSTARGARVAFQALLRNWLPEARALTAERLGRADEGCRAFVLGDGRVTGDAEVVFQRKQVASAAAEMKAAGALEEWRDQVALPCLGNPLLIVPLSMAFAGPLPDPRAQAIAAAAARLNALREAWANPPDLVRRVPEVVPGYPDRLLPVDDAAAATLKKRTLTNLYNARPAWLDHAHCALDQAVADACGWGGDFRAGTLTDDTILAALFALNQERAAAQDGGKAPA